MIIDASVAFKWLVSEDDSDRAIALLGQGQLNVPSLLFAEVGNALWKRMTRGEIYHDQAASAQLVALEGLVIVHEDSSLVPRALELGLHLGHAIYDCVYLALAEQLSMPLVTADEKFLKKLIERPVPIEVRKL